MVYSKEKWIATLKKAIADLKMENAPTAGKPCAIATLRYIRDGLLDDVLGGKEPTDDADKAFAESVKESCNELIKQLSKDGASDGFASNASAAAKAAGFKSTSATVVEISD